MEEGDVFYFFILIFLGYLIFILHTYYDFIINIREMFLSVQWVQWEAGMQALAPGLVMMIYECKVATNVNWRER